MSATTDRSLVDQSQMSRGSRDQLSANHSSPDGPAPLVGGGVAEAGAVLQEVDEDTHGAVQGGQEVGGVGHVLCNIIVHIFNI